MSDQQPATVLRAAAGVAFAFGLLLMLDSWDWLYQDALNLPQALPALAAQLGACAVLGLAYILWAASTRPELAGVAATGGAITSGLGTGLIGAWLIFRGKDDLLIGDRGTALLVGGAVVLAITTLALVRVARDSS